MKKNNYPYQVGNGYLDQTKNSIFNIQRYIYRNNLAYPGFASIESQFQIVKAYLANKIFHPLLLKIFQHLALESKLAEYIERPDQTLSLIYYPPQRLNEERLKSHKDTVAMTAVWAPETGLESKLGNTWHASMLNINFITIQLGQALELATGKQCHAIEHRVLLSAETERFSLASFFGPNEHLIFTDYKNDKVINRKYGDYVKEHLAQTYPTKAR